MNNPRLCVGSPVGPTGTTAAYVGSLTSEVSTLAVLTIGLAPDFVHPYVTVRCNLSNL